LDNSYFLVIITLQENARAYHTFFPGDEILAGKAVFKEPRGSGPVRGLAGIRPTDNEIFIYSAERIWFNNITILKYYLIEPPWRKISHCWRK
jgi:hypothetical protein